MSEARRSVWWLSVAGSGFLLGPMLPQARSTPAILAGGGGSELPWWSPLAASLLLLGIAWIYRMRTRVKPPSEDLSGPPPSPPVETAEPDLSTMDSPEEDTRAPMLVPQGI